MRPKLNGNEVVIDTVLYRFITLKDSLFKINCTTGESWILNNGTLQWCKLEDGKARA